MANEVALRSTALVLTEKEIRNYAAAFAASNCFKNGGAKLSPDQALVVIMAGQEYGWGPFGSIQNIHLIEGRPEISADTQARWIKKSGKYDIRVVEHTNEACTIRVISLPSGEVIADERYTMEDAERQELTKLTSNGKKTNWHKAPRNMLFARCVSNVCAFHCADAVPMRTYVPGEIGGEYRLGEELPVFTEAEAEELQAVEASVTAMVMAERAGNPTKASMEEVDEDPRESEPGYVCILEEPDDTVPENDSENRDNPADDPVYQTFLRQSEHFSQDTKDRIRAILTERGLPFKTSEIVKLIKAAGAEEAHMWLAFQAQPKGEAEPAGPFLPSGFVSRETGRQTTVKTINDAQLGLLHARVNELSIDDAQYRALLLKYCGVTSGREVPASDFNDLLEVIADIKAIPPEDTERRSHYL